MNRSYTTSNHRRGKIIERTVTELKTIIRDIILEVGELKERVALLELAINNKKSEYTEQLPGELSTAGEAAYAAQANNAEHNRRMTPLCIQPKSSTRTAGTCAHGLWRGKPKAAYFVQPCCPGEE